MQCVVLLWGHGIANIHQVLEGFDPVLLKRTVREKPYTISVQSNLIWNIFTGFFKTLVSALSDFNMEHLSSTHPINQHPSYDRYAEMTHFVNYTTTKSKSKYSILNIDLNSSWIVHELTPSPPNVISRPKITSHSEPLYNSPWGSTPGFYSSITWWCTMTFLKSLTLIFVVQTWHVTLQTLYKTFCLCFRRIYPVSCNSEFQKSKNEETFWRQLRWKKISGKVLKGLGCDMCERNLNSRFIYPYVNKVKENH